MIKKIFAFIIAAGLCAGICGCTDENIAKKGDDEIIITDMIGREIAITPAGYERVVCIGAGALRMYCYIGDVSLICGVEDIDNLALSQRPKMFDGAARPYIMTFGNGFEGLPSCGVGGPNAQSAEAEKILACKPDIVISGYEDTDKENALQNQLGVPVITLKTGYNGVFDEAFCGSLRTLGKVFGKESRAEELISFVDEQAKEISSRTADIPEDEKSGVYICGLGNWGTTDHLWTAQKYKPFEIANVKNVVEGLPADAVQKIDKEKFTRLGEKTDIVIIDAAAMKNILPALKEDGALFSGFDAKFYLQPAYNAYYTNHEIALANTWFIAKTVYPEKFSDIDMKEKTDEITKIFLGKELAEEIIVGDVYGELDF